MLFESNYSRIDGICIIYSAKLLKSCYSLHKKMTKWQTFSMNYTIFKVYKLTLFMAISLASWADNFLFSIKSFSIIWSVTF